MDYESICCSLQTVRAARMFYEYGKLDRLLERDITTSSDDLYEVYYELLIAATDYMDQKFNEDYEYSHLGNEVRAGIKSPYSHTFCTISISQLSASPRSTSAIILFLV